MPDYDPAIAALLTEGEIAELIAVAGLLGRDPKELVAMDPGDLEELIGEARIAEINAINADIE
jgi:hypothetical protein